ncbi:hypothetical protein JXA32_17040 [Candidatus Sumerlaeota bacterium]|nr:hypothetical protein [Candidatus Sumerlaeota bacterium]
MTHLRHFAALQPRDRYAALALDYVPHLTQLCDKNPYSPSYGCFDREYWHYRTLDFPCGMSQEFVLPFAQLFVRNYPGNKYCQWERMRELAVAGMHFAMRGSHKDGSCDDYFPWEQALGALAFSTYAITEAYQLLQLDDPELAEFFQRRGELFIRYQETGQLSNHQAFVALAAYNIYLITGDEKYRQCAEDRAALTLSWQHPEEGWFQEYEGADPGYHTCTIDFLAKLHRKSEAQGEPYDELLDPLKRAVDFAWHFMHPDGSYGGEYGSRNTYHFYPHGFELIARHSEKAGQIADQFLRSLAADKRYHNDDDRMLCHCVYNWLQAWDDYYEPSQPANGEQRFPPINTRENFLKWHPDAGLAVCKTDAYYAVANLNKGGVIKVFGRSPGKIDAASYTNRFDAKTLYDQYEKEARQAEIFKESDAIEVSGEEMVRLLCENRDLMFADLNEFDDELDPGVAERLPADLAEHYCCLPICMMEEGELLTAVADPLNAQLRMELERQTGVPVKLVVALEAQIREWMPRVYPDGSTPEESTELSPESFQCLASDTGLIGELDNGKVIVSHLMDELHEVKARNLEVSPASNHDPNAAPAFSCDGEFSYRQQKLNSPLRMVVFRLLNITAGRFFPNLLRSTIQKILITGKRRADGRFRRTIRFFPDHVEVADELPDPIPLKRLSAGSDATSIYVANSNVYQDSVLRVPWAHAPQSVVDAARHGSARWERKIAARGLKS